MRRAAVIGLLIALIGGVLTPAQAQSGLSDQEQTMLDQIGAAFQNYAALNSYQVDVTQHVEQTITVSYLGQNLQLVQAVDAEGTSRQARADNTWGWNLSAQLTENVSQQVTGLGQDQPTHTGPILLDLIAVGDQVYMRMKVPDAIAGTVPQGWQDVTNGAEMFPGMAMINIDQVITLNGGLVMENPAAIIQAVTAVEDGGTETVEGRVQHHYRLTLDPSVVLELGGTAIEQMLNADAVPFDVEGLVALLYTDPDTRFTLEIAVGESDQMIDELSQSMALDVQVGPDLITDPALKEAEMTLTQTSVQTNRFYRFDEPVDIQAPELAQ
jgi:hypothetical protein